MTSPLSCRTVFQNNTVSEAANSRLTQLFYMLGMLYVGAKVYQQFPRNGNPSYWKFIEVIKILVYVFRNTQRSRHKRTPLKNEQDIMILETEVMKY